MILSRALLLALATAAPLADLPRLKVKPKELKKSFLGADEAVVNAPTAKTNGTATAVAAAPGNGSGAQPVFLKLWKVGSATVSHTLSCGLKQGYGPRRNHAWRCREDPLQHNMVEYYMRRSLFPCAKLQTPLSIKLVVILRDPTERMLSQFFFWQNKGRGWRNEAGKALPRSPAADEQLGVFRTFVNETVRESQNFMNQYVWVLNGQSSYKKPPKYGEAFSGEDVARAKAALERDFSVVGVTEDLSGFLVHCMLELGWPVRQACHRDVHVNTVRPRGDAVSSEARAFIGGLLRPDVELYEHALEVAARQRSGWPQFAEAVAQFSRMNELPRLAGSNATGLSQCQQLNKEQQCRW